MIFRLRGKNGLPWDETRTGKNNKLDSNMAKPPGLESTTVWSKSCPVALRHVTLLQARCSFNTTTISGGHHGLPTSAGLLSSVPLGNVRSGGDRDLTTLDCWGCCCFSCCNRVKLFSVSVSFCCILSSWARCSSWITSSFSCRGKKRLLAHCMRLMKQTKQRQMRRRKHAERTERDFRWFISSSYWSSRFLDLRAPYCPRVDFAKSAHWIEQNNLWKLNSGVKQTWSNGLINVHTMK